MMLKALVTGERRQPWMLGFGNCPTVELRHGSDTRSHEGGGSEDGGFVGRQNRSCN